MNTGQQNNNQNNETGGKEDNQNTGSGQLDAITTKLAEIETKLDAGSEISSDDQKIIEALLANDNETSNNDSNKDSLSNVDVNELSNTQLVDYIVKAVNRGLDTKFETILSRIDTNDKRSIELEIDKEINFAKRKYGKDFEENWDATTEVAGKHPQLTAEECFLIATGKKKFSELSEKNKKEKESSDKKKAILGVSSSSGSADTEALMEDLKGKSHQEVAKEIAERLGLG